VELTLQSAYRAELLFFKQSFGVFRNFSAFFRAVLAGLLARLANIFESSESRQRDPNVLPFAFGFKILPYSTFFATFQLKTDKAKKNFRYRANLFTVFAL
jgi:hypothetical protein